MTQNSRAGRDALDRLAAALVQDTIEASDAEILAEFREDGGDPEHYAVSMRDLFERIVLWANKRRLDAARAEVAAGRGGRRTLMAPLNIAEARLRLRAVLGVPGVAQVLTFAARKENELSDADVLGMLEDLRELGVLPDDAEDQGR